MMPQEIHLTSKEVDNEKWKNVLHSSGNKGNL